MATQMDHPPTSHRAALEHPRHVFLGDLLVPAGRSGRRRPPGFQRAVENHDAERRDGRADRRDEERRHAQESECDQADQERQDYGGVETVFAAPTVHGPRPESTPDRSWAWVPAALLQRKWRGHPRARPQRARRLYADQAGFGTKLWLKRPEPSQKLHVPGASVKENQ